ncbi:MAG: 50S ribosomal protein L13 [Clostridia bacterium]|nr:50S ribosomal protein L13 [Clostridia bacterium]
MRTTYMPNADSVDRKWYVVDASGKTLGRFASEIAKVLSGKNKPIYTSFVDAGDYVIVINAEKIAVTGKKLNKKVYTHHTGYIGGLKQITLKHLLEKKPQEVIEHAVKGMLPKNTLGRNMMKKLHVYAGPEHPHAAQKPEVLEIKA